MIASASERSNEGLTSTGKGSRRGSLQRAAHPPSGDGQLPVPRHVHGLEAQPAPSVDNGSWQLLQIRLHDLDQFLCGPRPWRGGLVVRVDNVEADMSLDHLGHQTVQGPRQAAIVWRMAEQSSSCATKRWMASTWPRMRRSRFKSFFLKNDLHPRH
jgi:hypothetical protein